MAKELPRYLKKETEQAPTFFDDKNGPKEVERAELQIKIDNAIKNWNVPLETEEPKKPKDKKDKI